MSDSKWFMELTRKLQLDKNNVDTIYSILNEISDIINFEYYNKRISEEYAFVTGSLSRKTAIDLENVDVMVHIPLYMYRRYSLHSEKGPYMLVEDVYKKIKKNFIYTRLSKDGKIILDYKEIRFNILPSFKLEDETFLYPEVLDSVWINLDIKKSLEVFNLRDKENKGNMRNFCKLLKLWNIKNSINLSEILIDSMVYEFFKDYTFGKIRGFNYYDYYFYDFFKYIINKGPDYFWYIPATSIELKPRSPYLLNKKVKESFEIVKKAMDLYIKKYPHLSKENWELLLGKI